MIFRTLRKGVGIWQIRVAVAAGLGGGLCHGEPARLSLGPLAGANNVENEVAIVLQNPGEVVGLQMDLEPVAGRLEIGSFTAGAAATGLQLRSSLLGNGQTRVVLFSTTNTRLGEGEVVKVRGIRRNQAAPLEQGLSLRAVIIADHRGLLQEFAFVPFVGLTRRDGQPAPGQPVVFDGLVFPVDQAAGGVEVRVNGRLVAQSGASQFSVTWTPLEPGLAFVTAMTRGGAAAVPLSVPVSGGVLDTYGKWRAFHFPSDPVSATGPGRPLGDADNDTVLNLWEYLRGSAPNAATDGQPEVENTVVRSGPEEFLALRVRVRAGATDFEVAGEASDSLGFEPAGIRPALVVSREKAGEFDIITLRDTVAIRDGRQRFLRARFRPVTP